MTHSTTARAGQNLVWTPLGPKDADGNCESIGERNGNIYYISGAGRNWKATHILNGIATVLVEGEMPGKQAWRACVDHHNEHYIPCG